MLASTRLIDSTCFYLSNRLIRFCSQTRDFLVSLFTVLALLYIPLIHLLPFAFAGPISLGPTGQGDGSIHCTSSRRRRLLCYYVKGIQKTSRLPIPFRESHMYLTKTYLVDLFVSQLDSLPRGCEVQEEAFPSVSHQCMLSKGGLDSITLPVRVYQLIVAQSMLITIVFEIAVASDAHTHSHYLQAVPAPNALPSLHFLLYLLDSCLHGLLAGHCAPLSLLCPSCCLQHIHFVMAGISAILLRALQSILPAHASAVHVCIPRQLV